MRQHPGSQGGRGPATVGVAHHGHDRALPNPPAAALVGEHVAPSTGARRLCLLVSPVADRSRARDDHDAGAVARAGLQRNQRVVDDEHRSFLADAPQDAANDGCVLRAIDPGDTEADGGGAGPLCSSVSTCFHQLRRAPSRLRARRARRDSRPVRAPSGGLPVAVRQQADGFHRPASIPSTNIDNPGNSPWAAGSVDGQGSIESLLDAVNLR